MGNKLTKKQVYELGFSDTMIRKLLPPPEIVPNPRYKGNNDNVMKLWDEARVKAVMHTQRFIYEKNLLEVSKELSRVCGRIGGLESRLEEIKENLFFGQKMILREEETEESLKAEFDAMRAESKSIKRELGQLRSKEDSLRQIRKNLKKSKKKKKGNKQ